MRSLCILLLAATAGLAAVEPPTVTASSLGGHPVLLVRAPAAEPLEPATAARLQQRISVAWEDLPVAEACDRVARATGTAIVVAPELRAAVVPLITLQVDGMRADRVLEWIKTLSKVSITPMHGGLYVSLTEPERASRLSILRVGDLVHTPGDFPGPELALSASGDAAAPAFELFGEQEDDRAGRPSAEELAELLEAHIRR